MKKIQIINGINTDVGKTFVSYNMIKQKIEKGKKINYLKPIISGFDINYIEKSDVGIMLSLLGKKLTIEEAKEMTLYFFKEPTAPNIASILEGIPISYEKILDFCFAKIESALKNEEETLIEMAGGLFSPITESKTMCDLTLDISKKFQCKTSLVVSNYLGGISHTLSACKLFEFDEIIWNVISKTKYDDLIKATIEEFLGTKMVPLGGLEPPRA